jgi:hypothetical protein
MKNADRNGFLDAHDPVGYLLGMDDLGTWYDVRLGRESAVIRPAVPPRLARLWFRGALSGDG